MTNNPDDKRRLIIYANSEDDLRSMLRQIPGYQREELEDDLRRRMMLAEEDDRFYLQASNGERIIVSHRAGEMEAKTVNVMNQDALDHPVPIHQDELVKLHTKIKGMDGLYSQVIAAEIDLVPPSAGTFGDGE